MSTINNTATEQFRNSEIADDVLDSGLEEVANNVRRVRGDYIRIVGFIPNPDGGEIFAMETCIPRMACGGKDPVAKEMGMTDDAFQNPDKFTKYMEATESRIVAEATNVARKFGHSTFVLKIDEEFTLSGEELWVYDVAE